MEFKKGQIVNVKYNVSSGAGIRRKTRAYIGSYEIIRTGKRFYLYCNDSGTDWNPTKKELEQAIENFKAL